MKYQLLLWSLIAAIIGIESYKNSPTTAKPAPIFESVIEEVRSQIPSNLQLRLPGFIPQVSEEITLYSFIPDRDLDLINLGDEDLDTFMVVVSQIPDCHQAKNPLDCIVGIVGVSETSPDSKLELDDLPEDIEDLTAIELNQSTQGYYFIQNEDYQLVIWEQENLAHLLIARHCEENCLDKQDMTKMAISAANEPAISSQDSSYYPY